MPNDKNPFPHIKIIGGYLLEKLAFIPNLGLTHGDHFQNTGAEVMLGEQLEG